MKRRLLETLKCLLVLAVFTSPASAQTDYPKRTVQIVVPYAAGGATDTIARVLSQGLSEKLGAPFIIINQGGASTLIGTQAVARAEPDGYTLLLTSVPLITNMFMRDNVGYTLKDFVPISFVSNSPAILVVPAASPVKNVAEIVALAKATPNHLQYGSFGIGSSAHVAALMFMDKAGVQLMHIPYSKGAVFAVTATMAGEVAMTFATATPILAPVGTGKLRALGVASDKRSPNFPDVPTMTEAGLPMISGSWFGLLAPKGTPAAIVKRLEDAANSVLSEKSAQERIVRIGQQLEGGSSEQLGKFLERELENWQTLSRRYPNAQQ